ncbi:MULTISPECIES: hypothetical protein [Vibrio]|uniref:Uncharacterized protein n=1 Tax=Vibrio lentus TaxID=136468 RepID=A0A855IU11_9VIBR|nr:MULTISPECIES: hypothetical protein [Vibrio]MDH5938593.1 hypothetical protein [Vibrio splendidus]MDH5967895.1 hypothetical protein [Vibrio aestuarianus]PMM60651.1 hypothetical protein BCT50_22105 [Vibrio lentus]
MEHGALSPSHLKDACFLVGRAFGVRNLGRMLYEITLVESNAGQKKSQFGGVCSISHNLFGLMQHHHSFYEYRKEILKAFSIDLKLVKFAQLASNPSYSLIVTGAWIMANVNAVPKKRIDRAKLYSKWWRAIDASDYMKLTKEQD